MDIDKLRHLLEAVSKGDVSPEAALERLRLLPYEDLGHARLDLHRALRSGMPEVVFCEGKTAEQIVTILRRLWEHHERVLGTRLEAEKAKLVLPALPGAQYDSTSRLIKLMRGAPPPVSEGRYVLVAAAGTADLPVAEEAAQTLEFLGVQVERAYDIGVAGIHRLFDQIEKINNASIVISVAGMEGALTSVLGGLTACPVIGVPTSVGYGTGFKGLAALLAMLNSCASGVSVVNVDNGFGAAVMAYRILRILQPIASAQEEK